MQTQRWQKRHRLDACGFQSAAGDVESGSQCRTDRSGNQGGKKIMPLEGVSNESGMCTHLVQQLHNLVVCFKPRSRGERNGRGGGERNQSKHHIG